MSIMIWNKRNYIKYILWQTQVFCFFYTLYLTYPVVDDWCNLILLFFSTFTVNKMRPYSEFFFFTSNEEHCCCCFTGNSRKNRRTFFKIIDAAVVVAYTPLLINDRFCSRTSSLGCRQYCLSSAFLSLWSKQPRPYIKNQTCLQEKRKKKKKKKMPDARSCTLKKKREREKQTRFIYLSNQPLGNTLI